MKQAVLCTLLTLFVVSFTQAAPTEVLLPRVGDCGLPPGPGYKSCRKVILRADIVLQVGFLCDHTT
ncbi:hypothetical protein CBOM_05196 [Ceraceosorus bombacis]|uniref:Uncharacterized protein n=1 Tax=Ceraceosorus bombacis TaxID=401625 RepID=A0A0P1BIN4_9BASI|nr:hypothetical protein CBOM_05196 [Ceraceosorus bombacis]